MPNQPKRRPNRAQITNFPNGSNLSADVGIQNISELFRRTDSEKFKTNPKQIGRYAQSSQMTAAVTQSGPGRTYINELSLPFFASGQKPVLVGLSTLNYYVASSGSYSASGIKLIDTDATTGNIHFYAELNANGKPFFSSLKGLGAYVAGGGANNFFVGGGVNATGGTTGTNYSVSHTATGTYVVTLSGFSDIPVVTANPTSNLTFFAIDIYNATQNGFTAYTFNNSSALGDIPWNFIALGNPSSSLAPVLQCNFAPSEFWGLHFPTNPGTVTYGFSMYQDSNAQATQSVQANNFFLFACELF